VKPRAATAPRRQVSFGDRGTADTDVWRHRIVDADAAGRKTTNVSIVAPALTAYSHIQLWRLTVLSAPSTRFVGTRGSFTIRTSSPWILCLRMVAAIGLDLYFIRACLQRMRHV
jgi:hypothetical protein